MTHACPPPLLTPAQRVILQRNLIGAMRTYMTEVALLKMLVIAGPSTTRDLCGYARFRLPEVSRTTVQRLLTQLRRAQAIKVYPVGQRRMLWALPCQPRPRVRKSPVVVARPKVKPTPLVSWWLDVDRAQFYRLAKERFPA